MLAVAPGGHSFMRYDVIFYAPWAGPLLTAAPETATGGAETQVWLLARALAARGARVALVAYETDPPLPRHAEGVEVIVQRRVAGGGAVKRSAANVASLLRTLATADTEAFVQRSAGPPTGVIALLARLRRRRFVYSSSSLVDFSYTRLEPARVKVAAFELGVRLANRIVVQTDEQAALCRERFKRSPTVIRSIAELPAEPSEPVARDAFLWVGRVAHYKGPLEYVQLARAVPEARFRMVLVPSDDAALEQRVREAAAAADNLELLGPRSQGELMALIARSVAVVNTSEYEGTSNVLLEGWARGVGALVLHHDPDGVVMREGLGRFAAGSGERLAELTRELWRDPAQVDAHAVRCRGYVEREHSAQRAVERWLEVLS
jgi:glycosyltransferase involved in cell wall biosynthesis